MAGRRGRRLLRGKRGKTVGRRLGAAVVGDGSQDVPRNTPHPPQAVPLPPLGKAGKTAGEHSSPLQTGNGANRRGGACSSRKLPRNTPHPPQAVPLPPPGKARKTAGEHSSPLRTGNGANRRGGACSSREITDDQLSPLQLPQSRTATASR